MKKAFMIDMDNLDVVEVGISNDGGDYELIYFVAKDGQSGFVERSEIYYELEDALSICESYCRDMSAFYVKKGDLIADRLEDLSKGVG